MGRIELGICVCPVFSGIVWLKDSLKGIRRSSVIRTIAMPTGHIPEFYHVC